MEHYVFDCGKCGAHYPYVSYKGGFTESQRQQMAHDAHVCRKCGYDDREESEGPENKSGLDWGDNPSTESANFMAGLFTGLVGGGSGPKCETESDNPLVGMTQDPETGDLIMHFDPSKIPPPPDPIPVQKIMKTLIGDYPLVNTVLKGIAKGYPRCCIEFYARCLVGGLDPYKQGGVNIEPEWDRIFCPLCQMGEDDLETEIADREEIISKADPEGAAAENAEFELGVLRKRLAIVKTFEP